MADYEYAIGLTAETLQNLEDDLGLPPPHPAVFQEWSTSYTAGDGSVYGDGWPSVEWHFDYLSAVHVAALRTFCTGKSAPVYIRTIQADGTTYGNYSAVMTWPTMPEDAAFQMGRAVTDFVLKMTHLEVVT